MDSLRRLWQFIIDIVFPQSPDIEGLEKKTAGELEDILNKNDRDLGDNVSAIFSYRDKKVRAIIWEIKYRGNKKLASLCGEIIYNNLLEELSDRGLFENFNKPLLIPIPVTDTRRRERGWNQMELIALNILKFDTEHTLEYAPDLVKKIKDTKSQTKTQNKKERLENLKGSFSVEMTEKLHNRNIILLDDVITTGSTISEVKKVLKEAGAKKIISIALAH